MPEAYLTIDDGPSEHFEKFVDFLSERNIPALFFNRGDHMEVRPEAVIYGIQKGYIMGNHAYSHRRFSELSEAECFEEVLKTERILDDLYQKADVSRPGKYFRFPYMDRGMGPWLIEPNLLPARFEQQHFDLLEVGLGHDPEEPSHEGVNKKRKIQHFLGAHGFDLPPTPKVNVPFHMQTEMADARDCLCTFSTSDWLLNDRHKGKFGVSNVGDLSKKLRDDAFLNGAGAVHIVLAHDGDEIHDSTCAIIDDFLGRGFEFLDFVSDS